jgi:hypothetical protein
VCAGGGAVALDTSAGTPVSGRQGPRDPHELLFHSAAHRGRPRLRLRGAAARGGVRPAATSILASCACTRSSEATARRRAGRRRPAFRRARADARRPARCHAGDPSRLGWPAAATRPWRSAAATMAAAIRSRSRRAPSRIWPHCTRPTVVDLVEQADRHERRGGRNHLQRDIYLGRPKASTASAAWLTDSEHAAQPIVHPETGPAIPSDRFPHHATERDLAGSARRCSGSARRRSGLASDEFFASVSMT